MEAAAISTFMQETALHGARWIWFGSAALGRNDWSDCTTVIILGREELAPEALEDLARALFGDSGEPLQFMDPEAPNFPEVEARYVMRDGVQVVSIQLLMAAALGLLADLVAINEHATRL